MIEDSKTEVEGEDFVTMEVEKALNEEALDVVEEDHFEETFDEAEDSTEILATSIDSNPTLTTRKTARTANELDIPTMSVEHGKMNKVRTSTETMEMWSTRLNRTFQTSMQMSPAISRIL